jgi:hypothetical protein
VTAPARTRAAVRQLSAQALAVMDRFPPRQVAASWDATSADRFTVARRLLAPPFAPGDAGIRYWRRLGLLKILDWLELHPGATWQQRWDSSGAAAGGPGDWRDRVVDELKAAGRLGSPGAGAHARLGGGMVQLIGGDVIRPGLAWLLTTPAPARFAVEMERARDPAGIAALRALASTAAVGKSTFDPAVEKIAVIMAAKGGLVADITPGDCIELLGACARAFTGKGQINRHSPFLYELLHAAGAFPPGAPPTVRMISALFPGQSSVEDLVDRYDLACRPVRDLLVDYLRERQPGIDYGSLVGLVNALVLRFWKDLETHHPGIASLRLPPDVAAAWKSRLRTRTVRAPGGGEQTVDRRSADGILFAVRAFYLDLAQWALNDPARWGPWAVPCPVRGSDIQHAKSKARTKARMDARTRERLPVLPALAAAADRARTDAAARLAAARDTPPGEMFTIGGQELRRARMAKTTRTTRIWAEEPATGRRRDMIREEDGAFWGWAAIEVLRHTGIRIEELGELSHHSLVQYRLPSTGQLVPLLSVARPRPTPSASSSSAPSSPTSCPRSSPGSAAATALSRSPPPTTSPSAPGTRRCPCCSSVPSPWRTGPSQPRASGSPSAACSPPPASPAPTASPSPSGPMTSAGSSPPTPSSTACRPTSPSSYSATRT